MKIPKCTIGAKHKWKWIKNATVSRHTQSGVGITLVGRYKCECGESKIGAYQMEYKA